MDKELTGVTENMVIKVGAVTVLKEGKDGTMVITVIIVPQASKEREAMQPLKDECGKLTITGTE